MAVADTRSRILEAALACFLEEGMERTTTARIRERSGASNGALFHHFPSKEALADALYVHAIASFQEGLWELVRSRPRTLRAALRGAIGHQLRWIEENPELTRFLYSRGHLDWDSPAAAQVTALNRDLVAAYRDWIAPLKARGEVRPMSMLMLNAIIAGPAHTIARRWLEGQIEEPLSSFAEELADAAWAALRGKPVSSRPEREAPARQGRVALELIAEDGSVVAQGRATADLVPPAAQAGA